MILVDPKMISGLELLDGSGQQSSNEILSLRHVDHPNHLSKHRREVRGQRS